MKIFGCGLNAPAGSDGVSAEGICRSHVRVAGAGRSLRISSRVGAGAAAIATLALVGCGGGGGGSGNNKNTPPPPSQYTIGGTASGLSGTGLVLQDNGGDNLAITGNGAFTFATKVDSGGAYSVTVMTQPSGQTCTVTNGSGTASADVTSVAVTCTNSGSGVTVGGTVSGLTGTGLVLQDNGADNLSISVNGAFTFATALASGKAYAVTVLTQPTGQTCAVVNGTGTTGSANITNVAVNCGGGSASVGKFAYVANNGDGTISAYTIVATTGALQSAAGPIADGTAPAAVSLAPNGKWAYSASDNGLHIYAFAINQTTGALSAIGSPVSTGFTTGMAFPDIAVDAASAHLYIASAGDGKVAGFAIDQSTGALTPLAGSPYPAGAGASAIPAFSPNGKYLYVMDSTANAVSGYTIGSDGSLAPMASTFATGQDPTWISFTPDGKWAYVSDSSGADELSLFSVNATTGALTALAPPAKEPEEHPQDLTVDASGTHLYVPVANGNTAGAIDVYTISDADGSLTFVGTTGAPAGVTPVFLDIVPNGKFAYVASKGGAEVYGYSIDATSGALTKLPKSPYSTGTGSLPQFITVDPSGKFGYTANEGTANISEFAIDQTTGDLTAIAGNATIPAGSRPIFVSISPEAAGIRD
jgi:6-phosphogluconolactonase (cycloisomerase 2 family)